MDKKTLGMLEFPQIIDRLAAYASFSVSQEIARKLQPVCDRDLICARLETTREARHLLSVNDTIRLGGCIDVYPHLEIAKRGGAIDGEVLYQIGYMLTIGREISRSMTFHAAEYPRLAKIAERVQPPHGLVDTINNTVDDHGEVLDSASDKLAEIRKGIHVSHGRLLGKLERILKDSRYQTMLQEAIITQRNGRYVIPLKSEYKGQLKSIIHDQSSSGATLFVEPTAVVELNNAWHEMQLAERNEVQRVLLDLSAQVNEYSSELQDLCQALAEIDFALMCAKYAEDLHAAEPIISQARQKNALPVIKLYEARHPLLPAERVVPIDAVLDDGVFAVVITGPNTGGKTVTLKTIGLMILMAQSGLHIPVQSGSELSVFSNVFADIGDEQSIEQSLSTFSGHMTNVIRILKNANSSTLLLMDELGSGTDPQEGSALARAIMKYIVDHRVPCFAASHFSELKAFAHITDGVINASMEFDLRSLRPTYRLSMGLPGRSNALLISERLGLPQEILDSAKESIDPSEVNAESLLDEIHRQNEAARKARAHADRMRSLAENSQRELQKRLDEIEKERDQILRSTHHELEVEVDDLREEVKKLKRALQRAGKPLDEISQIESEIKQKEKETERINKALVLPPLTNNSGSTTAPLKTGDKVRVRSLGTDSLAMISSIDGDEAEITLGALRMRVPLSRLARKNEEEPEEITPPPTARQKTKEKTTTEIFHPSPGSEIDLRGKNSEEITDLLDKYLDDAFLAGLPYVRIIHGKGTGKLRQVTRQILLSSAHVKFIERGQDSEGGEGVTVAHMKS